MAAGRFAYEVIHKQHLEQTATLFIGLPAMLAIILALTPTPKSATGVILKGMTFLLLLSGPLVGEGFICVILAAPLFYFVGGVIGLIIDISERRRKERNAQFYGLLLLPLITVSLEGVHPRLSFERHEEVFVDRIIPASAASVEQAISSTPRFDRELPTFLRLRFPMAQAAWGQGLEPESFRAIRFTGPE